MTFRPGALTIALAVSGLAHLFWMSVINVVIVPDTARSVKFSRVYFLKPAISVGAVELKVADRQKPLAERRLYSGHTGAIPAEAELSGAAYFSKNFYALDEGEICRMVVESVSSPKSLPPRSFE